MLNSGPFDPTGKSARMITPDTPGETPLSSWVEDGRLIIKVPRLLSYDVVIVE